MTEGLHLKKRFKVQKDGFFNIYEARRRAVQRSIEELVDARKFAVIGATMFGSLTKGSSKYLSDVDVFLFYDTAHVAKELGVSEIELFKPSTLKIIHGIQNQEASEDIPIANKTAYWFMKLGEKAIRHYISRVRMPIRPHVVPVGMSKTVIADALHVLNGRKGIQSVEAIATRLSALFHQAVTQGVLPYRAQFLKGLLQAGPRGQKMWNAVIHETVRFEYFDKNGPYENKNDPAMPDPDFHYPKTLIEAIKVYAPQLLEGKNQKKIKRLV